MQIHELPTGGINDSQKVAFDTGTNTYAATFGEIANYIRDKLLTLTYSGLTTSNKTLPGAINEVNNKLMVDVTTSDTVTLAAGTHMNVTIPYIAPSGYNIVGYFIKQTPNSAWVFANVQNTTLTSVIIGVYNSAASVVSGVFQVGILLSR